MWHHAVWKIPKFSEEFFSVEERAARPTDRTTKSSSEWRPPHCTKCKAGMQKLCFINLKGAWAYADGFGVGVSDERLDVLALLCLLSAEEARRYCCRMDVWGIELVTTANTIFGLINCRTQLISCVRQLIKPNIVYKDTTGMTNHITIWL